jgi:mannose-6-phosphate isomerase-like protein (cupin superfamily)
MESMSISQEVQDKLEQYASNKGIEDVPKEIISAGFAILPVLQECIKKAKEIATLERYENVLKALLLVHCTPGMSGENARKIAQFQKNVGFLYKFKSYTIKATIPLGYTIFLHEPKEGFSFQIHKDHKVEVFHILKVMPGGYVFLCTYEDWKKTYDKESFAKWLDGEIVPKYDRFKFVPSPGDVFVVNELNIVHTVVGCILEEFANVSADMVDRLYDQNLSKRKSIPEKYTRTYAKERLMQLESTPPKRLVDFRKGWQAEPLKKEDLDGVIKTTIVTVDNFTAVNYIFPPDHTSEQMTDSQRHISFYVWRGEGEIKIGDHNEWKTGTPPSINISKGDLLFIPANQLYEVINSSLSPLEITEHHIAGDAALIKTQITYD